MSGLGWTTAGFALLVLLLALRLRSGSRRLRDLRAVARAFAEGRFDQRADTAGMGQAAGLSAELNALGERLDSALAESRRRGELLDSALGALDEGVACIDRLDRIVYANRAWSAFAGGGLVGRCYYESLPAAELREPVLRAWKDREAAASVDFEHQHRQLRARIARGGGEVVVLVLLDLTELKRLEAARRDFMAAVSHEFKTPLTSILGFTETLLEEGVLQDAATARGFIERIARHGDRLFALVKDVLSLSRLEQGAWPVRPDDVDLVALAREVASAFSAMAETASVSVGVEAAASVRLRTDPELVRQLIGNLVSNAIRYNRANGSVSVRVAAGIDTDHAIVTVVDTGIGIPSEHRERVFERFYRIDSHRSRATGGTGLGLAIVKHLAQVLGGRIALHSGPEGTRFEVYLRALGTSDDG